MGLIQIWGKRLFLIAYSSSSYCISTACGEVGIGRRTFYNWIEKDSAFKASFEDLGEARLDEIEKALFKRGVEAEDTTALIFLSKTLCKGRGYLEGARVSTVDKSPVLSRVIDDLMSGNTSVEHAALTLTREGIPLPEVIRLLLAKSAPTEPDIETPPIDEADMDRRYQAAMAGREKQLMEFLPERIGEVEDLKRGLQHHESFMPEDMDVIDR
jgi:hypothetical protein